MSDTFYFPPGVLSEPDGAPELDELRRRWYSRSLFAMGEPSLSGEAAMAETYRFLWLRTWGRPAAVRFTPHGAGTLLHVVELDGRGGYNPGNVSRKETRRLSPQDSEALREALELADVWNMPTEEEHFGRDGAPWILELRRDSTYRVVDRCSPEPGPYRALCELLIRQASLALDGDGGALD